jgi:N-acetylglucosaminyldiphosphoundecaprenol N-acetyl-beta-D-mannosaminyltransferase
VVLAKSETYEQVSTLSRLPDAVPERRRVVAMGVDRLDYATASRLVFDWAAAGHSRYVCVANVHMVMEAHDSPEFREVVSRSDLVTPDGMPLVWALRGLGLADASRVRGLDLFLRVAGRAAAEGLPVGLYGGTPEALDGVCRALEERFPGIKIACRISPPFRPLSPEEDRALTDEIVASGARVLFVGLGCPKQERWMASHKGRFPGVMVGVGAAFDFLSGRVREAPHWMRAAGLEWLFRLATDPGRLWKRYAKHNPRFAVLLLLQLLGSRYHRRSDVD